MQLSILLFYWLMFSISFLFFASWNLQAEGIFRINPENGQEEYVREQLNNGLIPDNIDVHCLAGLIKVHPHYLFVVHPSFALCWLVSTWCRHWSLIFCRPGLENCRVEYWIRCRPIEWCRHNQRMSALIWFTCFPQQKQLCWIGRSI